MVSVTVYILVAKLQGIIIAVVIYQPTVIKCQQRPCCAYVGVTRSQTEWNLNTIWFLDRKVI